MSSALLSNAVVRDALETQEGGQISVPVDTFLRPKSRNDAAPRVMDLFAGAGGFSLGFELAGAKVQSAIEIDAWGSDTLRHNHPHTEVINSDITKLSDEDLKSAGAGCEIIIGGPPCQGYSVANNKAGDPKDPRNSLFREFLRAIDLVKPQAVLMENVPGLLKRTAACKRSVIQIIVDELEALGYSVEYKVLEAQAYGVPQIRPRLFIYGLKGSVRPTFPEPTHGPASDTALDLFGRTPQVLPFVNLWDAISDLPELEAREGEEVVPQVGMPQNDYQRLVRAGSDTIFNHVAMNHSKRLVERFSHVKWGESGMHAPEEHGARKRNNYSELSGKTYSQNNRRMHPDRPCHTVPASFYANFIHPYKHRNFTPREGARIQSFPDWYKFHGKPTVVSTKLLSREGRTDELHLCQYNQIGNAVPPLLAYNIAKHLLRQLSQLK